MDPQSFSEPMTLSVIRTEKHFRDLLWVAQTRLLGWLRMWLSSTAGPVGSVIMGIVIGIILLPGERYNNIIVVCVALLGGIGFWVASLVPKYLFRLKFTSSNGPFQSKTVLHIDAGSIRSLSDNYEFNIKWSGFRNIVERGSSIILLTDIGDGLVIPDEAFSSERKRNFFIKMATAKISSPLE